MMNRCWPGETGLIGVHRSDPGMMLGYWNRPDEDQTVYRGDWFVGGDLGHFDDEGYIWYEGRNDDVMTSFGYRISPLEIENRAHAPPGRAAGRCDRGRVQPGHEAGHGVCRHA